MAINKSFVIKNGLEVNNNLIFADIVTDKVGIGTTNPEYLLHVKGGIGATDSVVTGISTTGVLHVGTAGTVITTTVAGSVGIGTTNPQYKLQVIGGIGVTDSFVTGVSTVLTTLRVGTGGTVLSVLGVGNSIGVGTASPQYLFHINSPVSTGQTALYVRGDVRITGDLFVDDITFDEASLTNLYVSGIGTIVNGVITNLTGTAGTITTFNSTNGTITNLTGTSGTITTFNNTNGTITNLTGTSGTITTFNSTNGTITNLTGTAGTITTLNSTSGTITTLNSTSGTITNLTGTSGTITTFNSTNGTITNLTGTAATIGTVKIVSGIITATSGVVTYYGDGTYLTGTASSPNLQTVLNTGNTSTIGINVTGVVTATSFVGSGANLTGIANTANIVSTAITTGTLNVTTSAVIGSGVTINSSGINVTGVVTATSFVGNGSGLTGAGSTVFNDTTTNQEFFPLFTATTSGTITASGISTSKLKYNPSTGTVTATAFVGSGSGLTGAGSTVFIDTTTNQEFFPLFTATTSGTITASGISTSKLTYNPFTGAITVVDVNSTSDLNLKENVQTVENALETINALRGVSFDWKETGRSSYGVIAQELEEVLPELVKQGEVKSVNYNGIIGVLIEAIKELSKEVEELKNTK